MALFTGKGDDGATSTFDDGGRVPKTTALIEALGTVDELNSFLGLAKVAADAAGVRTPDNAALADAIDGIQHDLFAVQAELAGADKQVSRERISQLEELVNAIELDLPDITTFFVSGGVELAARLDTARAIARRAERRVLAVVEEGTRPVADTTLAYINRLSSALYAFARLANHRGGIPEQPPRYA